MKKILIFVLMMCLIVSSSCGKKNINKPNDDDNNIINPNDNNNGDNNNGDPIINPPENNDNPPENPVDNPPNDNPPTDNPGENTPPNDDPNEDVIDYQLYFQTKDQTIYIGESFIYKLVMIDIEDESLIKYEFSNSGIVSRSNKTIKGLSEGSTTLTVTYKKVSTSLNITVKKSNFGFVESSIEVDQNKKAIFTLNLDESDNIKDVIYRFEPTGIASIVDGKIFGLQSGETTLTAILGSKKATLNVSVKEAKVYSINEAEYWINLIDNPDEVIMDYNKIKEVNNSIYNSVSTTKVYNLNNYQSSLTADQVKSLINNYNNISKYTVYNRDGSIANTSSILANRDLDNINSKVDITYGVITTFTSMVSYPTSCYSQTESINRFQETGLRVGEGVLIYHYSLDKEWVFVRSANYFGWISAKDVALCSKQDFDKYYNATNFLICTDEHYILDNIYFRMSDKIPYISVSGDTYKVLLPKRSNDGTLLIEEKDFNPLSSWHDGYLDYTYRNLYTLAFKLLDTPYRWGDYSKEGRDCSSTQNAIYMCFGFDMPRNTSNQRQIPTYSTSLSGISVATLTTYKKGTLIFTSSHVMMYLGCDASGTAYLLHNTTSGNICKLQTAASYGLSGIIGKTTLQ